MNIIQQRQFQKTHQNQARKLYKGFHCGRFYRFTQGPFCYLNGTQYVKFFKDPITKNTKIYRSYVRILQNYTLQHKEIQQIDLDQSDDIRIYKSIKLGLNNVGSKNIQSFIQNIQIEPHPQHADYFHLFFDFNNKKWIGRWSSPKFSKFLSIQENGEVVIKDLPIVHQKLKIKMKKRKQGMERMERQKRNQQKQLVNMLLKSQIKQEQIIDQNQEDQNN